MTDPDRTPETPPPASPLDELASATLDGEAGPAEATPIAGSRRDDVDARIADFTEVSAVIATPVAPVTDEQRDTAVTAALAAWGTVEGSGAGAPAPVDELQHRRRTRHSATRRWLGAAAALVVAVGLGAIVVTAGDDGDDASTAADSTADSAVSETTAAAEDRATPEAAGGSDAGGSGQTESGGPAADQVEQLGDFADVGDLFTAALASAAFRVGDPTAPAVSTLPAEDVDVFRERLAACPPDAADRTVERGAEVVAVATLDGDQVAILAESAGGETRLVVVDIGDCSLVATRTR